MRPRAKNSLITFQRYEKVENAAGEPVDSPEPVIIGKEFAEVFYGRGSERREAAREDALVPATFRVHSNEITRAIATDVQIEFDGAVWDIESNVAFGRDDREITATKQS